MEWILFAVVAAVIYRAGFSRGVRACMPNGWKRSDVRRVAAWARQKRERLQLATDDRPNLRREVIL